MTSPGTIAPRGARFTLVDALRGLAALWVAGFHFFRAGPMYATAAPATPRLLAGLLAHGDLGVQVFFVISGFVIAYSVADARIDGRFVGRFALRRAVRLDLPYWTTLFGLVALRWLAPIVLHRSLGPLPTVGRVAAHLVYLQNILGLGDLVVVFWTLCLEIQFYLVLVLLLAMVQRIARAAPGRAVASAALIFGAPLALSIAQLAAGEPSHVWFFGYWHLFFLGALTCWTLLGWTPPWAWGGVWSLVLTAGLAGVGAEAAVGPATAALIAGAGWLGRLSTWLGGAAFQYLGRISYSLYLLHVPVGGTLALIGWTRVGPATIGGAVLWMLAGLGASLVAADLFHRAVERPSIALARRIKVGPGRPALAGLASGVAGPELAAAPPSAS